MDLALNNLQWLICHKTKPNIKFSINSLLVLDAWNRVKIIRINDCYNLFPEPLWHYTVFDDEGLVLEFRECGEIIIAITPKSTLNRKRYTFVPASYWTGLVSFKWVFGCFLRHLNHFGLFNAKFCYIYIYIYIYNLQANNLQVTSFLIGLSEFVFAHS